MPFLDDDITIDPLFCYDHRSVLVSSPCAYEPVRRSFLESWPDLRSFGLGLRVEFLFFELIAVLDF